jgi:TolB-like protein
MTAVGDAQAVNPDEALLELTHILASPDFAGSRHLTHFLTYIVSESLAGRSEHLKERTVARKALGRDDKFDPRLDCVVRVVASKLRRSLRNYYALEGASNRLRIEVPKGTYCPVFRRHQKCNGDDPQRAEDAAQVRASGRPVLAVVPFRILTDGARERFLASLLADDLAVRLGRLSTLDVIDFLALRPPRRHGEDLCQTALRLHADFAFGGTISKMSRHFRVTARLIDGHNGVLAWADQYDRPIDNGYVGQPDDLADRIAASIGSYFGAP